MIFVYALHASLMVSLFANVNMYAAVSQASLSPHTPTSEAATHASASSQDQDALFLVSAGGVRQSDKLEEDGHEDQSTDLVSDSSSLDSAISRVHTSMECKHEITRARSGHDDDMQSSSTPESNKSEKRKKRLGKSRRRRRRRSSAVAPVPRVRAARSSSAWRSLDRRASTDDHYYYYKLVSPSNAFLICNECCCIYPLVLCPPCGWCCLCNCFGCSPFQVERSQYLVRECGNNHASGVIFIEVKSVLSQLFKAIFENDVSTVQGLMSQLALQDLAQTTSFKFYTFLPRTEMHTGHVYFQNAGQCLFCCDQNDLKPFDKRLISREQRETSEVKLTPLHAAFLFADDEVVRTLLHVTKSVCVATIPIRLLRRSPYFDSWTKQLKDSMCCGKCSSDSSDLLRLSGLAQLLGRSELLEEE